MYEKQKRRESVLQLKLKIRSKNLLKQQDLKLPSINSNANIKIKDQNNSDLEGVSSEKFKDFLE